MLIVLIHGLTASKRFFAGLEPELQKIPGVRTHSFDLLGFGENKHKGSDYSLKEHLEFITSEIEKARQNGEELVLAGHSMGGILALAWAESNPEKVSGIVLLNTPIASAPQEIEADFRKERRGWAYFLLAHRAFSRLACTILCRFKLMRLLRPFKKSYMTEAVFRDYTEHTFKSVDSTFRNVVMGAKSAEILKSLREIPILHLIGTDDIAVVKKSPEFHNVRRIEIPGGHHLPLENPSAASKAIADFLKETPA